MNYNLPVLGLPTPLRCLTFNASGQITVINVDKEGDPIVRVLREADADPDPSKGVVAASLDSKRHKLAVARKDGTVDLLNPHTGDVYCHNILVSDIQRGEGDIVGLHIRANYSTKRSCNILTCTTKGRVHILSLNQDGSHKKRNEWNVNSQGRTHFCQMDATEDYFVFGGSPDALSVWKVEECIWKLEDPKNKCVRETFFTCATFMEDNEETLVAGNNMHEVVVYDTKCWMGNPELKVTFWEEENLEYWVPITAIANDLSGTKVYIGNDSGDLASVDISSGRVIKCFENLKRWPHKDSQTRKVSKSPIQNNSIKFIARDTQHPLISSSLDSHLRFWNEDSGKLLSTVYPMQDLTTVIFDSC
ncbi:putative transcription factor WD40-like family [Rosa chinensis]|uniref:Putative transcription factor WD40-like family n=2 Tax=Rosa chinensis TaxID=74649 RepID=A0A2P6QCP7_ROSCH|nr:putative transcription factor WD40-like family [Rosa chinensis]